MCNVRSAIDSCSWNRYVTQNALRASVVARDCCQCDGTSAARAAAALPLPHARTSPLRRAHVYTPYTVQCRGLINKL